LRLALDATRHGFGLKDATPYNVMFDGPKPVFIDALSFERRDPLDILWRPYAQFVRTFIYPLLAGRYLGLRLDEMLPANRDGLSPERIRALCPAWRLWMPPFLTAVTIPALLTRREHGATADSYRIRRAKDAAEARFLLERLFRRAGRVLEGISVPGGPSPAERYWDTGHRYSPAELAAKQQAVEQTLARCRPANVLDIGCNTGFFSLMAARQGARVVSVDRDERAVGTLWTTARRHALNILPLVIDLARPPAACGWENAEFPSFLDRARGRFDCVLMLALLHHLLVNDRIPLDRILQLVSQLTTRHLILEYVDPGDAHFRRIARGREALHCDLDPASFAAAVRPYFDIVESWPITPTRRIYWLRKGNG
jgi:SAM-dependent methyltransferase